MFAHYCEVTEYDQNLLCLHIEFTGYNQDCICLSIIVKLQNMI